MSPFETLVEGRSLPSTNNFIAHIGACRKTPGLGQNLLLEQVKGLIRQGIQRCKHSISQAVTTPRRTRH